MASTGSRRARKRHIQQELFKNGGKRKGAGRKPKGSRSGTSHCTRPEVRLRHPLHVVLRVVPAVGSLRTRKMYQALREATIVAALRERIRIVHISLQRNHVHLLVEAENKLALSRGLQGFQISAARNVNAMLGKDRYRHRRGRVFADRYFAEAITTPRRARHALSYIMNNWRKHREDQQGLARTWLVDPFSSGALFPGWQELESKDFLWPLPETYDPLIVRRPRSWLLREGWKRHGPISARDVPSRTATQRSGMH
jgi:REP element-mobilizing transposase RayT